LGNRGRVDAGTWEEGFGSFISLLFIFSLPHFVFLFAFFSIFFSYLAIIYHVLADFGCRLGWFDHLVD